MPEPTASATACALRGLAAVDHAVFSSLYLTSGPDEKLIPFFRRYSHVYFFSSTENPGLLAANIETVGAGKCLMHDPRPPDRFQFCGGRSDPG